MPETKKSQAQLQHDGDTWVDRGLDYLREHRMNPLLEVMVSWMVCVICLFYYGYSYLKETATSSRKQVSMRVPLVTEEAGKLGTSPEEAIVMFQRLVDTWERTTKSNKTMTQTHRSILLLTIRGEMSLRRLTSNFMMIMTPLQPSASERQSDPRWQQMQELYEVLDSMWIDLLRFPPIEDNSPRPYRFELSLILPAFKEHGASVANTLQRALENCQKPSSVQVIIVDAGFCTELETHIESLKLTTEKSCANSTGPKFWGEIKLASYMGGGRGPCQNFGAAHATGMFLTFLHADCLLPIDWDAKVKATLRPSSSGKTVQGCAFSFGHNTSEEGLNGGPYPWGIRGVCLLGNLRAYLFSLP